VLYFLAFVLGLWCGALAMAFFLGRPIEIRYKQKDTYCDVWSPQLPGASAGGSYLSPALISFLRQHGEKLGIRLIQEEV
jgi:hypothetical protein